MNRALLNEIILKALYSGSVLSNNTVICMVEQEIQIDVRRYQNPITDNGDIRMQSIDSSERIADLINSFGMISDIEERYMMVLEGIQEPLLANFAMSSSNLIDKEWYINLSKKIQKINNQCVVTKKDEYFSEDDI